MKKIILILLLFLLSPSFRAQEFLNYDNLCLAKMDSIELFKFWSRPRALDFNKDGKLDFTLIDKVNDSLEVFFNDGTSKFTTIAPLKIFIGNTSRDLCVGDFDGDTYIDIATINSQGDLLIFKNLSGTGISLVSSYINTTNPNLQAGLIECGDLNNDSRPDIIGTGKDFATNLIQAFTFQNALSFNFGLINVFSIYSGHNIVNNTPTTTLAIADFNGDSFNDFVVGTDDMTDTLEIYPNLGLAAISFSSPTVYKEPFNTLVYSLEVKDYDGDSKPDIAIEASGGFSINKNGGALSFSSLYSDSFILGKNFAFKDVNSDTYPDLVIADWSGIFNVFKGTSAIGYPFWTYTTFTVDEAYRYLLEDFDGNAIPDFVFVGDGDHPYLTNSRNFSFHLENTIVSTNTAICGSTPVSFTVTNSHSSYPGTYSWTPGPSSTTSYSTNTSAGVDCAFSFTLPPGYGQCILYTDTVNVTTQVIPSAIISASVSAINCAGTSVPLIATVLPASTNYTWSTGQTNSSIVVSPTTTTTYSLFMDNGCQSTETYTLNVQPNPTVNITAPTTSICTGGSVTLTANGATNYTWFPSSNTTTVLNVNPASTTVYSLVGVDSFGCKDSTNTTITVSLPPSVNIVSSKPLICFPDTVTLSASGASSYTWSTGANTSSVTLLVFSNGNYSVTGSNGCISSKNFSLTGLPRPIVTITPSKSSLCVGDSVTLLAGGAVSYTWIPSFITTNTFLYWPPANQTFTVVGQGTNGCYNAATVPINVFASASTSIVATSNDICVGKPLTVTGIGAVTYTWNTGSNATSITETPSNTSPLSYTLTSTDINGCVSTATQTIFVSDKCQLTVYNGVTPNGDGNNDFFRIDNIEQYPGNVVMIFNRWGQKLDEITDYNNTNNFWSGTNNSKTVPSGTYYYIIDLKNGSELLKGYIELTKRDTN
jgi:gliding motility-associated-like protein